MVAFDMATGNMDPVPKEATEAEVIARKGASGPKFYNDRLTLPLAIVGSRKSAS